MGAYRTINPATGQTVAEYAVIGDADVADIVVAVARLHPRAHVPELTIKPTSQLFV